MSDLRVYWTVLYQCGPRICVYGGTDSISSPVAWDPVRRNADRNGSKISVLPVVGCRCDRQVEGIHVTMFLPPCPFSTVGKYMHNAQNAHNAHVHSMMSLPALPPLSPRRRDVDPPRPTLPPRPRAVGCHLQHLNIVVTSLRTTRGARTL